MENGFTKGKARMRFAQIAASPKNYLTSSFLDTYRTIPSKKI